MKLDKAKFHFIGVGGIGMCGLAELLHNMGASVTGSDLSQNANTEHLKNLGINIYQGHRQENVGGVDVVVFSSAVPADNPELQAARARKIPAIQRAEALAEIMRLKRGVAIGGTHGKTTTTAMAAAIFLEGKLEPTIVVGGRLDLIQSTARLGTGDWLIAEADESDGSFQRLSPEMAVITNIDNDHLDHFKSFENLQKSFLSFATKIPFYGVAIVWGDDPRTRDLFVSFSKRIFFYGFDESNDYVIRGASGRYELFARGSLLGSFELKVPGRHNALNAVAAILTALQAGVSFEVCRRGLLRFQGVDRRFHFKGSVGGVQVYDDYGHHPTEVRATLQAFREKFPHQRLVVLFQPHRYTRTQNCWQDFTTCFSQCDEVILTDIYAAGESPIPGVTSERLASEIKLQHVHYWPHHSGLAGRLRAHLRAGDIFVTLGAGDGWKVGMEILL